jgi:hydrogenase maturation protein HypF
VQGVGFRPFVYSLARELHVNGWVNNSSAGVFIEAECDAATLDLFIARLHTEKPLHAIIYSSETTFLDSVGYDGFTIRYSDSSEEPTTLILPDLALCDACLKEMSDRDNRRYRYPFITCTHCGPRYSIITSLPYDRPNTTMKDFSLCPECAKEYADPSDRRFHAQPIACQKCGPHIELWDRSGSVVCRDDDAILETARAVRSGRIVAMKGLGGFQLLADATSEAAVGKLRKRKIREEKPFAVMAKGIGMVRELCEVSDQEARMLLSPASPIVLLKKQTGITSVAQDVAPRNPYLGIMLPYTPLHHLLMHELDMPIVATSGNISDEPMCIDEREAVKKLGTIADLFLVHNRPIRRYVDDSIVRIVDGREMVVRRARGYAPLPLRTKASVPEPLLAVGGHLKNTIAVQKNNMIFVSQHIGDLETLPALNCFHETIDDIAALYHVQPGVIVHDAHPDYASTHAAFRMPGKHIALQHHYAHIASCMAEHELNEPLLGIAWDGTGYGLDGTIWGGEFIMYDGFTFSRIGTFSPFPLPGGDAAVKESIRSAIGMLYAAGGRSAVEQIVSGKMMPANEVSLILQMLEKNINSPMTSSVGRIFDGIGALLGIRHHSQFEGQTAMEVEFAAGISDDCNEYPFSLDATDSGIFTVQWNEIIRSVLDDRQAGISVNDIARRFHTTLASVILNAAQKVGMKKVLLSGGCFQNMILLESTIALLRRYHFSPYWHQRIPTNDGGISVGQAYMYHMLNTR